MAWWFPGILGSGDLVVPSELKFYATTARLVCQKFKVLRLRPTGRYRAPRFHRSKTLSVVVPRGGGIAWPLGPNTPVACTVWWSSSRRACRRTDVPSRCIVRGGRSGHRSSSASGHGLPGSFWGNHRIRAYRQRADERSGCFAAINRLTDMDHAANGRYLSDLVIGCTYDPSATAGVEGIAVIPNAGISMSRRPFHPHQTRIVHRDGGLFSRC